MIINNKKCIHGSIELNRRHPSGIETPEQRKKIVDIYVEIVAH